MQDASEPLSVIVRPDELGYWVEWANGTDSGSLGPYRDVDTAEKVRSAKEREYIENKGHIDDT